MVNNKVNYTKLKIVSKNINWNLIQSIKDSDSAMNQLINVIKAYVANYQYWKKNVKLIDRVKNALPIVGPHVNTKNYYVLEENSTFQNLKDEYTNFTRILHMSFRYLIDSK